MILKCKAQSLRRRELLELDPRLEDPEDWLAPLLLRPGLDERLAPLLLLRPGLDERLAPLLRLGADGRLAPLLLRPGLDDRELDGLLAELRLEELLEREVALPLRLDEEPLDRVAGLLLRLEEDPLDRVAPLLRLDGDSLDRVAPLLRLDGDSLDRVRLEAAPRELRVEVELRVVLRVALEGSVRVVRVVERVEVRPSDERTVERVPAERVVVRLPSLAPDRAPLEVTVLVDPVRLVERPIVLVFVSSKVEEPRPTVRRPLAELRAEAAAETRDRRALSAR